VLVVEPAHELAHQLDLAKPLSVFTLSGSSAITDHDLVVQYCTKVADGEE
jgi:hypothetical protein